MSIFSHLLHPGTTPTPDGRTEPKEPEVILPYHNENTAEGAGNSWTTPSAWRMYHPHRKPNNVRLLPLIQRWPPGNSGGMVIEQYKN
ncbi:hypothetical protein QFZ48_004334 [Chitinophaga sp. W2I13]|uniref:hypothetical protein n=1 Tax=Chitinophaga sp. W2I13 TaxID=3373923 RepID=UPI003D2363A6